MSRYLIIVGAGGLGREVRWLAEECGRPVLGFLDDHSQIDSAVTDTRVLGPVQHWHKHAYAEFIIAVADPRQRRELARRMGLQGQPGFASLIHPSVGLPRSFRHGEGLIMAAGCAVTTDISVGRHVILDRRVAIGHDCSIRDFCTVAPAAVLCSGVHLASGVQIGAGACVGERLQLDSGSMLGMGAVLTRNAEKNHLLLGNPAEPAEFLAPFEDYAPRGKAAQSG